MVVKETFSTKREVFLSLIKLPSQSQQWQLSFSEIGLLKQWYAETEIKKLSGKGKLTNSKHALQGICLSMIMKKIFWQN